METIGRLLRKPKHAAISLGKALVRVAVARHSLTRRRKTGSLGIEAFGSRTISLQGFGALFSRSLWGGGGGL